MDTLRPAVPHAGAALHTGAGLRAAPRQHAAWPARERGCEDVRQDLCRFAAEAPTQQPVAVLARHAQSCARCSRYVDDLARVRAWLDAQVRQTPDFVATLAELAERARDALALELAARLARDLWDLGHGRPARSLELRRRDVRRLLALHGPAPLREDPWPAAVRLLARARGGVDRAQAVMLATRLDPCGLDLALSHVALLEHRGEREAAEVEADRLLGLLG